MCLRWQRFLSFSVFLAWIVVDRGSATPAQHVFTVDEVTHGFICTIALDTIVKQA